MLLCKKILVSFPLNSFLSKLNIPFENIKSSLFSFLKFVVIFILLPRNIFVFVRKLKLLKL